MRRRRHFIDRGGSFVVNAAMRRTRRFRGGRMAGGGSLFYRRGSLLGLGLRVALGRKTPPVRDLEPSILFFFSHRTIRSFPPYVRAGGFVPRLEDASRTVAIDPRR